MSEEWGPWIEHDGKGCPVKGMWVLSEERNGLTEEHVAMSLYPNGHGSAWQWDTCHSSLHILRYRVRKPKALQRLIQMVENLPAPSKQYEDA